MRILFIGCVESSYILLKELLDANQNIVGVITKRDSAFNADFKDVTPLCIEKGIPIKYVSSVNEVDAVEFIRSQEPDIGYCFGWSQLVSKNVISLFPCGMVGFHPASLPYNKGRHPIIWALVLGLKETASSFFMLTEKADDGQVISQEKIEITYADDARTLYDKIMQTAKKQVICLAEVVSGLSQEDFTKVQTNDGNVWRKRCIADGRIDWRMSSLSIYNLVRGLTHPYVGAHIEYKENNYSVWKVKELVVDGLENIEPGKIISCNDDGTIDIKAYDNVIRLLDYDRNLEVKVGDYI